ncbi:MAG TPA: hypothetical protein VN132_15075, partial [Bdellovibrio sp.]|nr:hypothetical protein [Bdellovibrio sp.]
MKYNMMSMALSVTFWGSTVINFYSTPAAAQISEDGWQMRARNLKERAGVLEKTRATLKTEFVGIDQQIDQIMNSISSWYLLPEAQHRPLIINLWGMTGTGKTSLVRRLVELLDFDSRYTEVDVGQYVGQFSNDHHVKGDFLQRQSEFTGSPMIWLFDEFQTMRTIDKRGNEIDRPLLRNIWGLFSDGIVKLRSAKDELRQLFHYRLSNPEFKLNDALSVAKIKLALKLPESEVVIQTRFNNEPSYVEYLLAMTDRVQSEISLDYRKSLIFVSGNIDEAFQNVNQMDPDLMTADEFHENSKTVTVNSIKNALLQRFRAEQIARLGNIHIVYPTFSEKAFRKLITNELARLSKQFYNDFGLRVSFSDRVTSLIYSEGVVPAQGARPVLSSVTDLITSKLPQWTVQALTSAQAVTKIVVDVLDESTMTTTGFSQENSIVFSAEEKIELKATEKLKMIPSEHQTRIAYHEAGHAIVGTFLLLQLPLGIYSRSGDASKGGFVRFEQKPLPTKKEMLQQLAMGFAGLASEELIYGKEGVSSGSSGDIRAMTDLAGKMIQDWGMGNHLGQSSMIQGFSSSYSQGSAATVSERDAKLQERLLKAAYKNARKLLEQQRPLLDALAKYLTEHPSIRPDKYFDLIKEYSRDAEGLIATIGNKD